MTIARVLLCAANVAVFLGAPAAWGSDIGHEIAEQVDTVTYRHYLDDLLFTHYGDNRGFGGPEHDPARDNIAATFQSLGLEVELHPFFYWYGGQPRLTYNVVATQPGTVAPASQYVLGAHYDSADNPGADDDASGVAGLLEMARVFSQYETAYTIKYIAFDLEEHGLVGSEQYVGERVGDDVQAMVQLDMIAWDWRTYKCVLCRSDNAQGLDLADQLSTAVDEYGGDLVVRYVTDSGPGSDHRPFGQVGYAACLLIENRYNENPCYHRPCDSVDEPNYLSYLYAADMTRSTAGFLADHALAYHPGDCDQDGVPDAEQIQDDPSLDCNGNGVLDVCEPGGTADCNDNGVPDVCDLFDGTSADRNHDAIPDECQNLLRVPAEYPTIQAAIDAAEDGDLVLVADGVFTGPGNKDLDYGRKAIWIGSENGPDSSIIDCQSEGRASRVSRSKTATSTRAMGAVSIATAALPSCAVAASSTAAPRTAARCPVRIPNLALLIASSSTIWQHGTVARSTWTPSTAPPSKTPSSPATWR